ncbi:MAG: hypothetical protein ACRD3E_10095 [Terriglobales bacterium]
MARILSVSYDQTLLLTREWMLKAAGHDVVSAAGFHDAREACARPDRGLFILGHSIPERDKLDLIACFRAANPTARVIALTRAGERRLNEVDAYVNPGEPEELVRLIEMVLNPALDRRQLLRVK